MPDTNAALQTTTPETKLFEMVYDLWITGESSEEATKTNLNYWNGLLNAQHAAQFTDQKKTPTNVIKEIVECKLDNMLDAQFTIGIVPVYNAFATIEQLKDMQDVADIYNDEVHNVLKNNDWDSLKERIGRWGLICGHGAAQTTWDDKETVIGEVKITDIDPSKLRWNKGAKKLKDLTFVAYETELNPGIVKKTFAKKDNVWDVELCKKIDDITESQSSQVQGKRGGIVTIQYNSGGVSNADIAYSYDGSGINAGKTVKLIVMFLLDDTLYAPEKGDNADLKQEKIEYTMAYPNGRMIVFSAMKDKKFVLKDVPSPEGFRDLGNIDIFNPLDFVDLKGKNEVEDIIPTQDRINGARLKQRTCIGNHINAICLDSGLDATIGENELVNNPVIHLDGIGRDGAKMPGVLNNNQLVDIEMLEKHIQELKQDAYALARLNETMISGVQPKGVSSADQLEVLQESPMATIRAIQRNFKNFVVRVGEKIVTLIQENYTVQRLIELSTGIQTDKGEAVTARINMDVLEGGKSEKSIDLIDRAGAVARKIKVNPDWKFKVEVVAGTEIPRSRRELARLMDSLLDKGIINPADIDQLELYLKAQDIPNYRALITLLRNKQKDAAESQKLFPTVQEMLKDKDMAKALADILTALQGFSKAKGQILKVLKLISDVDDMESTPIGDMTSKADIKDVAIIAPTKVSKDPEKIVHGAQQAAAIEVVHKA